MFKRNSGDGTITVQRSQGLLVEEVEFDYTLGAGRI